MKKRKGNWKEKIIVQQKMVHTKGFAVTDILLKKERKKYI